MANLKEIRGRISSIGSTMKITSAMKMVSASKLKKAQEAIAVLRPYAEKLHEIIQNVHANNDSDYTPVFAQQREEKKVLYIAVSSNRGLAGAFNSNIAKNVRLHIKNNAADCQVLTIGKKIFDACKSDFTIYQNKSNLYDKLTFEAVVQMAEDIINDFKLGHFDAVYLVYNHSINAATQEIITEQLLPITLPEQTEEQEATDYIFEPENNQILDELIPKSLFTQIYKAILDSVAAEHGARMTAMHKATDNAKSIKNDLLVFYNKARQAAITNEILEIVSGAKALEEEE